MNHEWQSLHDLSPDKSSFSGANYIGKGTLGRKTLCIINKEGKWYALDGKCPHAGGPLFAGKLEGDQILCPWHRFGFDLNTGQSESGGYFINTYPVKEEKGQLWIKVKKRKWKWWPF